eukprot:XP_001695485.1 predicted protein [Chlamydomonas reinhardtii]
MEPWGKALLGAVGKQGSRCTAPSPLAAVGAHPCASPCVPPRHGRLPAGLHPLSLLRRGLPEAVADYLEQQERFQPIQAAVAASTLSGMYIGERRTLTISANAGNSSGSGAAGAGDLGSEWGSEAAAPFSNPGLTWWQPLEDLERKLGVKDGGQDRQVRPGDVFWYPVEAKGRDHASPFNAEELYLKDAGVGDLRQKAWVVHSDAPSAALPQQFSNDSARALMPQQLAPTSSSTYATTTPHASSDGRCSASSCYGGTAANALAASKSPSSHGVHTADGTQHDAREPPAAGPDVVTAHHAQQHRPVVRSQQQYMATLQEAPPTRSDGRGSSHGVGRPRRMSAYAVPTATAEAPARWPITAATRDTAAHQTLSDMRQSHMSNSADGGGGGRTFDPVEARLARRADAALAARRSSGNTGPGQQRPQPRPQQEQLRGAASYGLII